MIRLRLLEIGARASRPHAGKMPALQALLLRNRYWDEQSASGEA